MCTGKVVQIVVEQIVEVAVVVAEAVADLRQLSGHGPRKRTDFSTGDATQGPDGPKC